MTPNQEALRQSKKKLRSLVKQIQSLNAAALETYYAAVQDIVNKHGLSLATGQMSDTWQAKFPEGWVSEFDRPSLPIFRDLKNLAALAEDIGGIGPTNLERFNPKTA